MSDPIDQIAEALSFLKDGPYRPLREAIADALRAAEQRGREASEARIKELEAINAELCSSHNALLADGARWQTRAEVAEAGRAEGRAATNMFNLVPCPKCGSEYRWPTTAGTIQCDDCGLVVPLPAAPGAEDKK
jgi:hypothetical protein